MSASSSLRPPRWLAVLIVVATASVAGLPIGSWAMGLALVLITVAALATIVGLKDHAKSFGSPILVLITVGTGADMVASMARQALADPQVQRGVVIMAAVVIVVGGILLLGKAAAHPAERHAPLRPSFRHRAAVTAPEEATPERDTDDQTRDARGPAGPTDDDLHLFGGGHRGT